MILDRPRHDDLIAEVRKRGARIRLITDGDVAGAISTGWPGAGTDILFGIGGTPEGVLAAAALKCMGAEIQGRLYPRDEAERTAAIEAGYDLDKVLTTDDLVQGNNCFFAATGITDGELLQGVQYHEFGATTQSLVMRSKSGTLRKIDASHALEQARRVQLDLVLVGRSGRPVGPRPGGRPCVRALRLAGGHGQPQLGPVERALRLDQLDVDLDFLARRRPDCPALRSATR